MATLKNLSLASLGAVFIALGTTGAVQAATFYGEEHPLGNGSVRSFATLDDVSGKPLDVGVTLTQGALSLPTGDTEPDIVTQLSLPPEASATGFNHLELTYRPHGYPGVPEVFNVPRFSLDFFLINPQERGLICPHPDTTGPIPTCVGDELAQAAKTPEPGTLPEGFLPDALVEAGHGRRYYDPDTPFPFTSFSEYSFNDSQLSFMEVVAKKDFLEAQPNVTTPIKLPTSYSKSGYYPTEYSVTYDTASQEYRVAYGGLTYRSVPEPSPTWGLLALGAWGVVSRGKNKLKKQKLASR